MPLNINSPSFIGNSLFPPFTQQQLTTFLKDRFILAGFPFVTEKTIGTLRRLVFEFNLNGTVGGRITFIVDIEISSNNFIIRPRLYQSLNYNNNTDTFVSFTGANNNNYVISVSPSETLQAFIMPLGLEFFGLVLMANGVFKALLQICYPLNKTGDYNEESWVYASLVNPTQPTQTALSWPNFYGTNGGSAGNTTRYGNSGYSLFLGRYSKPQVITRGFLTEGAFGVIGQFSDEIGFVNASNLLIGNILQIGAESYWLFFTSTAINGFAVKIV